MKDNAVLIIAEAGVNHNGDINLAKKLIDVASEANADVVKFQTYNTEKSVRSRTPKAEYQKKSATLEESQFEMIKRLELSEEDHKELLEYCNGKSIQFMSAASDIKAAQLLVDLGRETIKIPSGELVNYPFLKELAKLNKNIILSSGMANIGEIEQAVETLLTNGLENHQLSILHCHTEYPTEMADVNLKALHTLKAVFPDIRIGFSDHTLGIEASIAAVALGAKIIEKHFTLDTNMDGPDHKASLNPFQLKGMVKGIRNIELALGNGVKKPSKKEEEMKKVVRKSIVAAKPIQKGEVFTDENITTKKPADGISPLFWENILGKTSRYDFQEDENIEI